MRAFAELGYPSSDALPLSLSSLFCIFAPVRARGGLDLPQRAYPLPLQCRVLFESL
jgi:hypothetical protein